MASNELIQAARNPRWQIAGVLAAIAVVAVALAGGFRESRHTVPQHGVQQRVMAGALAVTVLGAWLDTRGPTGYPDSLTHRHYLVLDAVVENLTDQSNNWYLRDDLRWLRDHDDQKGAPPDATYLADDGTLLTALQPHLPVHVLLTWKVAPEQSAAEPMRWGLYQRSYYPKAYISNESGWLQDGPGASFKLAVEDRRHAGQGAAP